MDHHNSRIAFVTDDGTSISSHFGRALFYEVVTVHDGKVTDRKRLDKAAHHTSAHGAEGGHDASSDHKHAQMTAPLEGVNVLVARGMGFGAHQHLTGLGIEPILTDLHTIDEGIEKYLAGTLAHDPARLHQHGAQHH
jgi:predicted Fe-Mo cluster-binding NifX family protein